MSWHRHAACRDTDPDLFFSECPRKVAMARELCAGCPVRAECREEGQQEDWGVWGGELRHRVKASRHVS